MNAVQPPKNTEADDVWVQRRAGNLRLALILGGIVIALFVIALWKYRPL